MSAPQDTVGSQGMAPPTKDTVQITFRIPTSWLAEADAIAKAISSPGFEATRTDALRAAIARGIEAFKAEGKTAKKPRK
jgi:hypothetical protein